MGDKAVDWIWIFITLAIVGWEMYDCGKDSGRGNQICQPDQYQMTLDPVNAKETIVCKKSDGSLYTKEPK